MGAGVGRAAAAAALIELARTTPPLLVVLLLVMVDVTDVTTLVDVVSVAIGEYELSLPGGMILGDRGGGG